MTVTVMVAEKGGVIWYSGNENDIWGSCNACHVCIVRVLHSILGI